LEFRAGEVRRRRQARAAADELAVTAAFQCGDDPVGARVLPHDGIRDGQAGAAVPHDRRLALVRDPDAGEVAAAQSGAVQRRLDDRPRALPDLQRIVLDPAGARQDLRVLQLVARDLGACRVEHQEPRARGAVVDRPDQLAAAAGSAPRAHAQTAASSRGPG
jgi:hypothetical protein